MPIYWQRFFIYLIKSYAGLNISEKFRWRFCELKSFSMKIRLHISVLFENSVLIFLLCFYPNLELGNVGFNCIIAILIIIIGYPYFKDLNNYLSRSLATLASAPHCGIIHSYNPISGIVKEYLNAKGLSTPRTGENSIGAAQWGSLEKKFSKILLDANF